MSGFLAIVCLLVVRCYDGCLASSWLVGGEPLVPAEQRPPSPRWAAPLAAGDRRDRYHRT